MYLEKIFLLIMYWIFSFFGYVLVFSFLIMYLANSSASPIQLLAQINYGAKPYHRGVWGAGGVIGLCGVPIRILYQKAFFDRNLNKIHNKFFPLLPLPLFLSIPQDGLSIVTSVS